jgi:hypothetical protein
MATGRKRVPSDRQAVEAPKPISIRELKGVLSKPRKPKSVEAMDAAIRKGVVSRDAES